MNKLITISIIFILSFSVNAQYQSNYYSKEEIEAMNEEDKLVKDKNFFYREQLLAKAAEYEKNRVSARDSKDFKTVARIEEKSSIIVNVQQLHISTLRILIRKLKSANKDYLKASPLKRAKLHRNLWMKHRDIDWDFWMQRCIDIAGNQYYEKEVIDFSSKKPHKKYPYKSYVCSFQQRKSNLKSFELYKKHKGLK